MRTRTLAMICGLSWLLAGIASAKPTSPKPDATNYPHVHQDFAAGHQAKIDATVVMNALTALGDTTTATPPSFSADQAYRVYTNDRGNHRLLVFLPGKGMSASDYQQFLMYAAHKNYHVIGLGFWNNDDSEAKSKCYTATDQDADTCFTNLRHWQFDGGATLSTLFTSTTTGSKLNIEDTVQSRLRRLLKYLAHAFPNQGWKQFAQDGNGDFDTAPYVKWSLVTMAAHSEGTKVVAYMSKNLVLARGIMMSGPNEHTNANDAPDTAAACPWDVESGFTGSGGTPSAHMFGFWSEHDLAASDLSNPDADPSNDVDFCQYSGLGMATAPLETTPWNVDQNAGTITKPTSGYQTMYTTSLASVFTSASCSGGGHWSTVADCGQTPTTLVYANVWDYLVP